ncbi:DNA polymerase III subunit beta [Bermanella marisrubri]|uniref:Beta sliding clamp n=1 Tax=Bermanella marisrubri TaxID=207949 RepID=Q1MXH9_9GAMM|nr:DNA polymerase III subunit beta [Bermanella marisrubri]EAT10676.1 DNA polymerase III subunit beta [Oceanobacter sp. RED65] [Bermanella marisrubri]QIZ82774.1 DNA polymerase III subunit beta [Bermanella marisrubri]
MKLTITREALLKPLQLVAGVVERRQTLPVLSNVLLEVKGDQLSLTGTDLELELIGSATLLEPGVDGAITVPAKKLMDICKSLPDQSTIEISQDDHKVQLQTGRSKFVLSSLPANEFPNIDDIEAQAQVMVPQTQLRRIIDRTAFAMAQQDVRYYLNGMLIEVKPDELRAVATDGHRLATCGVPVELDIADRMQVIVPRKAVLELAKLLMDPESSVELSLSNNHVRAKVGDYTFTSKLVDGKFPDYERVIPRNGNKTLIADRQALRQVFQRTAILSNEKYRGVRLLLENDNLQVVANNPEQEQAEESIGVEFQGEMLEIGFNVSYLQDVLSVLDGDDMKMTLADANSSAVMEEVEGGDSLYVVMPMRL